MDRRVRERVENQAHDHWHELSIIIAGGNLLLAVVLFGRVLVNGSWTTASAILLGAAIASTLGTILAYYSIQIGQLLVFGPLRLLHIATSFLIAASQLALFLWPTHVASQHWRSTTAELNSLRHWLILYAAFSFVAVAVIVHSARVRRSSGHAYVGAFEDAQRFDKFSAFGAGLFSLACWGLTYRWLLGSLIVGVLFAITASVVGLASQARVAKDLLASLAEKDDVDVTSAPLTADVPSQGTGQPTTPIGSCP